MPFNKSIINIFLSLIILMSALQPVLAIEEVEEVSPQQSKTIQSSATILNVISDRLDYDVDANKFIATGNAQIVIEENNSKLKADVITLDQNTNIVFAQGHVRLIKDGSLVKGDFVKIDLNKESALISKPITKLDIVNVVAQKSIIYANDIIEVFKGKATIDKKVNMFLSSYQMNMAKRNIFSQSDEKQDDKNQKSKSRYKIIAKNVIVKGEKKKNIIQIKNAEIYRGKVKIASIPALELSTDKEMSNVETSLPEIGHNFQMGYFAGPGYVFHVPGGATFKAAPLLTGGGGRNGKDGGIGIGGIGRITTSTNRTEFAYGTTKDLFVLEGEQKLFGKTTKLVYGQNAYMDDGIMGRRLPDYLVEVVDGRGYYIKDLDLKVTTRLSAGYVQDYNRGWGTGRFMAQGTAQRATPMFSIGDWCDLGMYGQYNVTIYGDGSRFALIGLGPMLNLQKGPAMLYMTYLQNGIHGGSPMNFDQYYYGKSNLRISSIVKLNEKIDLGYLTYLNLTKDNWDKKLLAENQFYVRFGSEDLKFKVGYDTVRESSVFGVDMILGSDRTALDFEKMKIINPNELSKPKTKTNEPKTVNL